MFLKKIAGANAGEKSACTDGLVNYETGRGVLFGALCLFMYAGVIVLYGAVIH
ncbi:hypothetical protein TUM12370_05680 [Salmonella enterica subsp. enterica serovar Choleraesuis]|nr:hypothetical protein TUM12370_05680 [Salmonella enterica subsp. enterica serovar Choleraesuis]